MKIISWNIGKYSDPNRNIKRARKLVLLKKIIDTETPDILCLIEGTQSKDDNTVIKNLLNNSDYTSFYEPSTVLNYPRNSFEFYGYKRLGLKIYIKNKILNNIISFTPSCVKFEGRLISMETKNPSLFIVFLHRNMSQSTKDQNHFIDSIYRWCEKGQSNKDNVVIIGDFNLSPWSQVYYSEKSNYLLSHFIEQIHLIRIRNSMSFFNPIVDTLSRKNQTNLVGTFYSNKKTYRWDILDYALIKNFDSNSIDLDIITQLANFKLLKSEDVVVKNFLNYNLDHLPIKLTIQ